MVGEGEPANKPDVTISMNEEVFLKIFNRKCDLLCPCEPVIVLLVNEVGLGAIDDLGSNPADIGII